MKHFRSVVSLLMVFVLCFGMIPCAFAEEITSPDAAEDTTPTEAPPGESTEAPTESATVPPAEETTLPEESEDVDSDDRVLDVNTYASTQNSIMLFDYADNGDYTTRLNYQVSCTYKPNGSGTTRTAYVKNMGWHLPGMAALPMRMNRCTALSHGEITVPAHPEILLTGM